MVDEQLVSIWDAYPSDFDMDSRKRLLDDNLELLMFKWSLYNYFWNSYSFAIISLPRCV